MPDTFVETSSTSWLSRIGQSITGVLFGIVFIAGSIILLFWNEGRAIQSARSLAEGGKVVVDVSPDSIDPANEGKLIHVSGDTRTTAPLTDREFSVSTRALRLVRIAEMYQWQEEKHDETHKSLGGSEQTVTTYTYKKVWLDHAINSQNFRHPEDHVNPQKKFGLSLLPTNAALQLDPQAADPLKPKMPDAQVVDGKIYIAANPDSPQIGDYRISYVYAEVGSVSAIGRQAGSGIVQYQTKAGDRLLLAVNGQQAAADMFKQAEQENRILTWVIRLGGVLAMWLGAYLILRPLVVVADVVPLIGNVLAGGAGLVALTFTAVVGAVVIALAWLWYQPIIGALVLVAGVAVGFAASRLAAGRKAARSGPAAA
jgi:Transmembrane protein 43